MKKATKQWRGRTFWVDTVSGHSSSGQTVKAYCASRELSTALFYQWRKRLSGVETSQSGLFTAIDVQQIRQIGMEVLLPGGVVLRFSDLAPVDYLRRISAEFSV